MSGGAVGSAAAGPEAGRERVCGFCGEVFEEDRGQPACLGCPLAEGCRYVRCPACGYENPVTPAWLERLRARWPRALREVRP